MAMAQRKQTAGGPAKGRAAAARRKLKVAPVPEELEVTEETLISRWAESASTGVILCRNYKHDYPDEDYLKVYRINLNYSVREMTCRRCGTKCFDVLQTGSLRVIRRRYEYVQGYQREKGADGRQRLPRWAVSEVLEQRIDYLTPPEHIRELFSHVRL